ncbi:MAG: hypothetical protein ABI597_05015 [Gammaproteobacteria bacterium]
MKYLARITLCTLLLSACSTTPYHYQSHENPQEWKGKNISQVVARWGTADQIFHTRSGASFYLYMTSSGRNFFDATTTNFALTETGGDFPLRGQSGLQCSAIFKTDKNNIIIATSHSGSNCGGEWAPNS